MKLQRRSIHGLAIALVGFVLLSGQREFYGTQSLSPQYALQVGGQYLIFYAIFAGGLVGVAIRFLEGKLFEPSSHRTPPEERYRSPKWPY